MGNEVFRLLLTYDFDRKEAQDEYRRVFGVAVVDPTLDDELEQLLREQRHADKIELPPRLVLALVMRPRSKTRGRPPRPKLARRQAALLVRKASHRWDALIEAGVPYLDAKAQAAEEVLAEALASGDFEHAGITTAQTLAAKMRRNMR